MKGFHGLQRLLKICFATLLVSAGMSAVWTGTAGAVTVIENNFTGTGTLKVTLEQGAVKDVISCTSSSISGTESNPPSSNAELTSWNISGCTVAVWGEGVRSAAVWVTALPSVFALNTSEVRIKGLSLRAEYKVGSSICHLEVPVGTAHYSYTSGSSTNELSGAAPVSAWPWDGGALGCFTEATGALQAKFTFPDPQFELVEAISPTSQTKSASNVAPTSATLNGTSNPNGFATTYQFEYGTTTAYGSKVPASPKSIGSGSIPVEVSEGIEGLQPDTTYHFRLVATNAGGVTQGADQTFTTPSWKILSTLNPEGADDSYLYDVSCEPSTSLCTAVGKSTSSGVDSPLTHRWNGSSWSEQVPAEKAGAVETRLFGVDCPSETRCIAVGSYETEGGQPTIMAELWNENKWSNQTTPVPAEATSSELVAIGCSWTSECGAVGSAMIKGVKTAIAERWKSPTWSLQTVPIPEGATSSQLDGVDCLWSTWCVAVGRYTTSGGSIKSLAMFWNGTEWKIQTLTDPEGATQSTLLDISCTSSPSNRCMAVGGWKNSANEQFTLAYRFNGTSTWTLQSTPNPAGSIASVFQEVSCATETSCTAAGSWVSGAGGSNQTLAEKWNGSSWSIQGTQNPPGATFSAFFGVSCRSTTCMGVGWSTDGSGVDTTLAEIRE